MKIIRNELEIPASAEEVWTVLTDFSSYPEWNVYSNQIMGSPMSFLPFIAWDFTFKNVYLPYLMIIEYAEFPYLIRIKGTGLPDFIFRNEHCFRISRISDASVLFTHTASLSGLVMELTPPESFRQIEENHQEMNEELRKRVLKKRTQ